MVHRLLLLPAAIVFDYLLDLDHVRRLLPEHAVVNVGSDRADERHFWLAFAKKHLNVAITHLLRGCVHRVAQQVQLLLSCEAVLVLGDAELIQVVLHVFEDPLRVQIVSGEQRARVYDVVAFVEEYVDDQLAVLAWQHCLHFSLARGRIEGASGLHKGLVGPISLIHQFIFLQIVYPGLIQARTGAVTASEEQSIGPIDLLEAS